MTTAYSDYSTTLGFTAGTSGSPYTDVAGVLSIEVPDYVNESVEVTNHGSGGWKEFISGKLLEVAPIKFKVLIDSANISTFEALVVAGSLNSWCVQVKTSPTSPLQFKGICTNFKLGDADAKSPKAMEAEVTIQPSGVLS